MRYLTKTCFPLLLFFITFHSLEAFELGLKHRQGSGIGYKKHYSTISLYHAFENRAWQPFIDIRYLILNQGRQGANLGAGLGYQFSNKNRLSLYSYFDLAQSRNSHLFNQVTGGIAYTHPLSFSQKNFGELTCYLNGYFPLKSVEKNVRAPSFSRFVGHHLLINQTNRFALTGGNLELGYLSNTWKDWNLYVAGSAYYFKRSDLHTFGGFGKLRITYNDLINVEVGVSGDRLFGTNVTGTVGIRIPLGKKGMKAVKNRHYCPHKSRPIERLEPIVLKKRTGEVIARDAFGAPLHFLFVNNLSGSNGTFEDPFPTLLEAQNVSQAGQFIYVFPGDGTTTGMDVGFAMQENQTLAGSGTPLAVPTQLGSIITPAFTSQNPKITNTGGHGVTLNRNCTISGMIVDGADDHGFFYQLLSGSSDVKLFHCSSASANSSSGFTFIEEGSSSMTAMLSNCSASLSDDRGFSFSIEDSSAVALTLSNCSANNNGDIGFELNLDTSGSTTTTVSNCIANLNDSSGFDFFNKGSATATFSNCSASANDSDGFSLLLDNLSSMTATFSSCSADSNTLDGFHISNEGLSQVILSSCSANSNKDNGLYIANDPGGTLSGSLNSCSATDNDSNDFDFELPDFVGAGTNTISKSNTTLSIKL